MTKGCHDGMPPSEKSKNAVARTQPAVGRPLFQLNGKICGYNTGAIPTFESNEASAPTFLDENGFLGGDGKNKIEAPPAISPHVVVQQAFIDTDIANDPCSTANMAVPAEFAGQWVAERFIGKAGRNRELWNMSMGTRFYSLCGEYADKCWMIGAAAAVFFGAKWRNYVD